MTTRIKQTGNPIGKIVALPIQRTASIPLLANPIVWECVIRSARPQRTNFMPSVETNGWGRSSLVSRVPFMNPQNVETRIAQIIRRNGFVMPDCIITPIRQVARIALYPTDRSIPAVINASSMPDAIRQFTLVCFRMFIRFGTCRNLPGRVIVKMINSNARTSSGPSFIRISPMPVFFSLLFMRFFLPMLLS